MKQADSNPSSDPTRQGTGTNRREFLRRTAGLAFTAAAFPALVPASALGRAGTVAPSNKVVVGCIGQGPQGMDDMTDFLNLKDAQVVAVCDVKKDQLEKSRDKINAYYKNQDCKTYGDLREVVERKDIDAFLIATPDHWHVLAALAAVRAGKDIYLEKPMGLNMTEDWALRREVHRHQRVFQFGTQQRSGRLFRFACELVRSGAIGKLKHINAWSPGSAPGGSTQVVPVPAGWNYDMWLGPAPFKPYTENLCSASGGKKTWWFNSSYALGFVAGWGIHPMDIAAWGGGELLSGPIEVEGRGTFYAEGACDTATVWNVNMQFGSGVKLKFVGIPNGGNAGKPTCDTWPQEAEWKQRYRRITDHGTAFEGTEGWIHIDRDGINLQPEDLIDRTEESLKVQLPKSPDHVRNFVDCVKSRAKTVCPIDDSVFSDSLCHISEIAMRLNRKVVWDPKKEHFIGDAEANLRLLGRKMRAPWKL